MVCKMIEEQSEILCECGNPIRTESKNKQFYQKPRKCCDICLYQKYRSKRLSLYYSNPDRHKLVEQFNQPKCPITEQENEVFSQFLPLHKETYNKRTRLSKQNCHHLHKKMLQVLEAFLINQNSKKESTHVYQPVTLQNIINACDILLIDSNEPITEKLVRQKQRSISCSTHPDKKGTNIEQVTVNIAASLLIQLMKGTSL